MIFISQKRRRKYVFLFDNAIIAASNSYSCYVNILNFMTAIKTVLKTKRVFSIDINNIRDLALFNRDVFSLDQGKLFLTVLQKCFFISHKSLVSFDLNCYSQKSKSVGCFDRRVKLYKEIIQRHN